MPIKTGLQKIKANKKTKSIEFSNIELQITVDKSRKKQVKELVLKVLNELNIQARVVEEPTGNLAAIVKKAHQLKSPKNNSPEFKTNREIRDFVYGYDDFY